MRLAGQIVGVFGIYAMLAPVAYSWGYSLADWRLRS